jgi:hypothetical protein
MIEKIRLDNILFLDIETVPEAADFNELDGDERFVGTQNPIPAKRRTYS